MQQFRFWVYPKELKGETQTGIGTPMFTTALFTVAKRWRQLRCPSMAEWMNKMWNSKQRNIISLKEK